MLRTFLAGGVDGGRQRFDPERSWADNTNLDKARKLLEPIKLKYGLGLSWGDLIVLAGNTAIESMGGPVLGFCAGRIDDFDGSDSLPLGPSAVQEELFPCAVNGTCESPLGSTTVGLIYLNPEGPMGQPRPDLSARDVRDAFGRMAMNDSETVSLIGGGHAFGKTHGACPAGPGPSPREDPYNPWPGKCGTGKGKDAFTSGFEGPWTPVPTQWDNDYFVNLLKYEWEAHKGPGGHFQWRVANASSPIAPGPQGGNQSIMALTSDVSLTKDPTGRYQEIVKDFAENPQHFDYAFMHSWYKLTTRDMGPVTRCVGKDVPEPQPFQFPLPPTPDSSKLVNFTEVAIAVAVELDADKAMGPSLVRLAWRCAGTYRRTDYQGGCNGARIRFSPQKDWSVNRGLDKVLNFLKPIKERFDQPKLLSWADLIALAGTVALKVASKGRLDLPFCAGRTDAQDGEGSKYLAPRITGNINESIDLFKDYINVMGLSLAEFVALSGAHSYGTMHKNATGYSGSWTADPFTFSNDYFTTLLQEQWEPYTVPETKRKMFKASGKDLFMLKTDLIIKADPEMLAIAQEFAGDENLFFTKFADAWTKLMNADRFDGPTGNLCYKKERGYVFKLFN